MLCYGGVDAKAMQWFRGERLVRHSCGTTLFFFIITPGWWVGTFLSLETQTSELCMYCT